MPKAQTLDQLELHLNEFKRRYNTECPHSSLGQKNPRVVHQAPPSKKSPPETVLMHKGSAATGLIHQEKFHYDELEPGTSSA